MLGAGEANNYGLLCMLNIYSSITSVSSVLFPFHINQCLAPFYIFNQQLKNLNFQKKKKKKNK